MVTQPHHNTHGPISAPLAKYHLCGSEWLGHILWIPINIDVGFTVMCDYNKVHVRL